MLIEVIDTPKFLSPVKLFAAVRDIAIPAALLESAAIDEENHFSIIAWEPRQEVILKKSLEPFNVLRSAIESTKLFPLKFPFSGGLIGFFPWQIIGNIEPKLKVPGSETVGVFYEFSRFFIFNHQEQKLYAILLEGEKKSFWSNTQKLLTQALQKKELPLSKEVLAEEKWLDFSVFEKDFDKESFTKRFHRLQEYLYSGDIFQIVFSNQFSASLSVAADGLDFYQALRLLEPTTHLVFFDFGPYGQFGSASPEILGSKRGLKVKVSPIAGTRYRGKTPKEDAQILEEMMQDPKENAEHDMLVDLGRNDLGRVCAPHSISVVREKYGKFFANVMHLISDIEGVLQPQVDAVDFFKAIFPAGTLSGAPKFRAIELIHKYEASPREIYGGAMGYFSTNGDMEFCIAIRSFHLQNNRFSFRTGSGIVLDSVPEKEWLEIHNKGKSLCKAFHYIQHLIKQQS